MHIKTFERPLSREVYLHFSSRDCLENQAVLNDPEVLWNRFTDMQALALSESVANELRQLEQKTNLIRSNYSVSEFIDNHKIKKYTVELNRELTAKYGQTFSAQVFKELIEREPKSKALLMKVMKDLQKNETLNSLKPIGNIRLVVSFGLGWKEEYTKKAPYYVREFLDDIKAIGLPVTFLQKDAYGTVADNVEQILPQLRSIFTKPEDIILISLCKGTPELFSALALLNKEKLNNTQARIIGHINLSGMLSGAIFSDFAKEIVIPRLIAPLLKFFPTPELSDSGKMMAAIEYMKTSIIESALDDAIPYLTKDIFTVNVTGAPMNDSLLKSSSPMKPIIKYGIRNAFINSANDGFLELPSTLIPEKISKNQATIVLNSSHMLSDGDLNGIKLSDKNNRRKLYHSVIKAIIKQDPLSAGLVSKL